MSEVVSRHGKLRRLLLGKGFTLEKMKLVIKEENFINTLDS